MISKNVQLTLSFIYLLSLSIITVDSVRLPGRVPIIKNDNGWSFAILSDIHIGDGDQVTALAKSAVAKINSIAKQENIKMVFITGDLTNSAMPWQFKTVREILDGLVVPYIPTIGNHDMWPYNDTYEAPYASGDQLFAQTFADKFQGIVYNNRTVWNTEENIFSWFQNWQFQIEGMLFISLDWNSRAHAVSELGYKGAMPGCQLHDFDGGTLPWFAYQLEHIPESVKQIVLLQHQPFRPPWYIPGFIYAFSDAQKTTIRHVIQDYQTVSRYWGVFAGHFHMWSNGTAFDELPNFIQWETSACKKDAAISLIKVVNDRIVAMEKLYGDH